MELICKLSHYHAPVLISGAKFYIGSTSGCVCVLPCSEIKVFDKVEQMNVIFNILFLLGCYFKVFIEFDKSFV